MLQAEQTEIMFVVLEKKNRQMYRSELEPVLVTDEVLQKIRTLAFDDLQKQIKQKEAEFDNL